MADEAAPAPAAVDITFTVKSSNDVKYTLTMADSTTVGDLKTKLSSSEFAGITNERQRLIYSGRVLKDADTLASYKVKAGNTIHLVKGAESNQRQNPANQGGAVQSASTNPAGNVPSNIAAGTGAHNPLAHLTGARYAGFHQLPGMDMFGADGGMGAPPDQAQMLRMLDDPNVASQISEAMNNPAVLDMMRNNPMLRNNPMARQALENPALRRMMFDPNMIRMQMNMQRQMGGGGEGAQSSFPAPGVTETTPGAQETGSGATNTTQAPSNPLAALAGAPGGNPFAALLGAGGAGAGRGAGVAQNTSSDAPGYGGSDDPLAAMLGAATQGEQGAQADSNPLAAMSRSMMQNPEAMRAMMQMMGGMNGQDQGAGTAGANPFGNFGAFGQAPPTAPADDRPPEDRYADQLRQLNDMGFFEFDRNVQALRRSGGSVQGAIEFLLNPQ